MSIASVHDDVGSKQSLASFFQPYILNPTLDEETNNVREPNGRLSYPEEQLATPQDELDIPFPLATLPDCSSDEDDEDDDDGLDANSPAHLSLSDEDEGGFGDEEQVDVAVDAYSWKINHSNGHHRLRTQDFLSTVHDPQFDGTRALEMLQQRYTIDYGSRKTGSRSPHVNDEYHPLFFLDMIIIVGRPLKAITHSNDRFFDNITISFRNWRSSYSYKHLHGFSFDLQHRTFRLATAATRESWFIVMHPNGSVLTELPSSRREQRKRSQEASKSSALQPSHAQFLASYIKQIFLSDELLGEGVEASWVLDGQQTQNITFNKWTIFQERFMEDWDEYIQEHTVDPFWHENQPAFHAYDYGANIEIQVNDRVRSMPKEVSVRPLEDSSDDDEGSEEEEGAGSSVRDHTPTSRGQSRIHSNGENLNDGADESGDSPSAPVNHSDSDGLFPSEFYPGGLSELRTELERKYIIQHIATLSYALAVDLNSLDGSATIPDERPARCLLADRNLVAREFRGARDFCFFPLAFHPAYGNFSSTRAPNFLNDHVLAVMRDNMSYRNGGTDPLSYGHFQGYSNLKRSIRHGPDALLATKGIATGALTLPESEAQISRRLQTKRARLRRQLLGHMTPDDPDASRPFAREQRRVDAAIEAEEFAFRMEQVVSVQIGRLSRPHRRFDIVLQPILQLMRFFLREPQHYTHVLRSFRPSVFPGILSAYARLFDVTVDEIRQRMDARKAKGVDVALAEGVAAIDRLASYCFTGFPRSLMASVLRPLNTIESIEQGAWPYIDPRLLDLQTVGGDLNVALWPRGPKDRPILMHVAALAYHYGSAVAISRQTHVWFQELGGKSMLAPSQFTRLLENVLEELLIPQQVTFFKYNIERRLRDEDYRREVQGSPERQPNLMDNQFSLLERWSQSKHPFAWREFEPIMSTLIAPYSTASNSTSTKARLDFARELYECCTSADAAHKSRFASTHATWFAILRHILQNFTAGHFKVEHWVAALSAAMLSCEIECVPGVYRSRLSFRRVIRLIGYTTPAAVLSAPPGSLKRSAMEAQHQAKRSRTSCRIDFGCSIPFTQIPELVKQGFEAQELHFRKGDSRILEHYQVARNCVESCLGDPLCDLLLMLVLTMASCSITPTVAPQMRHFDVGAKKDPALFAANLVTRMLWYLRPGHFPWKGDHQVVLCVPEMTKKIEHKGVSNRLLRELGWVKVIRGNRDTPRNDEIQLQDADKLLALRKELCKLQKDAAAFIARVFHSHEPIWLDRCSAIWRDQEVNGS